MRRSLVLPCLLVLLLCGCDWEYFYDGDSYTRIIVDDLTVLGGCRVGGDRSGGAKSLVTMIDGLPELREELRAASAPPLVFFTAGAVDAARYDTAMAAALLDFWVGQVLSVREDLEVIQFNYFGSSDFIEASSYRSEPRWSLVQFPEYEASGYLYPGVDRVHVSARTLARRAALFFRTFPGYTCASSFAGTDLSTPTNPRNQRP